MPRKARIITTAVIKGGTGKTTTAAALAQAGAAAGKKVLAIDLDPQANLTQFLGADQTQGGCYALLHGTDAAQTLQHTEQGIDCIAGKADLATETSGTASARRLSMALEPIRGKYDCIIIDTPPQMGELTFNALYATTDLIIPLETDNSSLQGLYKIVDIAKQIQANRPDLRIRGIVLTRYDARANLNRYLRDVIAERGAEAGAPFLIGIRPGIAVREAQALRQSLFEYAPQSKPAQDYLKLYKMIMEG